MPLGAIIYLRRKLMAQKKVNKAPQTSVKLTGRELEKMFDAETKRNFQKRNTIYLDYLEAKSPKGSWLKPLFHAFMVGGIICCFGQMLGDIIKSIDPIMNFKMVSSFINSIIIFLTTIFTGIGVFDHLGRFAGAGTVVPITGFANSIASSAMEYRHEGLVFGLGAKMFYVAGPVLVNGVTFSIIVGLIYCIFGF